MFDSCRNNVASFITKAAGSTEDREVIALRPAARKDHFAGLAAPDLGDAVSSVIKQRPSATTYVVDT